MNPRYPSFWMIEWLINNFAQTIFWSLEKKLFSNLKWLKMKWDSVPCLAHRCLTRAFWRHKRADAQVTALQEFLNEPFQNKIQRTILDCEMTSKTIYIWTNIFMKFQSKIPFFMFQHEMMLSRLWYSILLQNFIQLLSSTDGNWTVLAVWLA